MAFSPIPRRHRALLPACDRLESRELLSGMTLDVGHAEKSPHAVVDLMAAKSQHKLRGPIITRLSPTPNASFSTVPPNGDVNPYGVALIPNGFPAGGTTQPGDVLVSNWNDSNNLQGTGTTIVSISPSGSQSIFYQGPQGIGVDTALGVLKSGFVIVGNVPAAVYSGNGVPVEQGSLLILNRSGQPVANLTSAALLNGPWDASVIDDGNHAQVFVSNVLSGTVTRINLKIHGGKIVVQNMVQIASGYAHEPNLATLVVGPTGLAFDAKKDIVYVASTADNAVYAISNAATTRTDRGTGRIVYQDPAHLRGPLGLVLAPNGNLLTTNGDAVNSDSSQPSELIEFTTKGKFVGEFPLDQGEGAAFGLATTVAGNVLTLWSVDDVTNTLDKRSLPF
jgi:hypothetical protein